MSERTRTLMRNTPIKALQVALDELSDDARATRPGFSWKLDLERGRLLTESYRLTENEPMKIRRAKALAHILENMTIYIRPDELIVGNYAANSDSVSFYPELSWKWIVRETAKGSVYEEMIDDAGREELKEICDYWGNTAIHHRQRSYLTDELKDVFWVFNFELSTPNYEKILHVGLKGILEEVKDRRARLDQEYMDEVVDAEEFVAKKDELDAMAITLDAVINWSKRYASLALEMASEEPDQKRKSELEEIAARCTNVPENPARTFAEALQSYWFIHLIVNFIDLPQVGSGIRMDHVFNSFYVSDVEAGRITRESAQEMMEFLFVKFQETGFLQASIWTGFGAGALGFQTVTIGGVDADGNDVTNEISYIVLDATKEVNAIVPPLALRWHDGIPQELVDKAMEVMASGMPQPAIFNDKVNITRLANLGCPPEDARSYSINNCMVPIIPGKNISHISDWAAGVPLPLCLTSALGIDNGFVRKAGNTVLDLDNVSSMQEVMDATIENYGWYVGGLVKIANLTDKLYKEYAPRPFVSSTIDDCIERGQDVREWDYAQDYRDVVLFGLNTVADSLAAIKKVVFEDKTATMKELVDALKDDWQGHEKLRKACLSAPKFGNDDDYVDLVSREFGERITQETMKCKTTLGSPCVPDGTAATAWWSFGRVCGATPDGRVAGDAFNDGSISPMGGCDKKGPTAVLNSVAKVDPLTTWNHLLNQTIMPQYLSGPNAKKFGQYLKTSMDLGIHHIQFTTVDQEMLCDAQEHPEKYPTLQVRVAGFAAYFIDLDRHLQDAIIARSPQCM
jgi:formate C-acetyltransferase